MRTLLLRPPPARPLGGGFKVPPLGLLHLAATLLDRGHPVAVIDAFAERLTWRDLDRTVRSIRPDLLGMTVLTPVREAPYRAAKRLRPFVRRIVLGGPHVTAMGAAVFRECPEADFLAVGEGEETLVALVEALDRDHGETPAVPGILQRGRDGGPATRPDLNKLPWPSPDLVPLHAYRHPLATGLPMFTMLTSRGCPGRCTFCAQSVSGGGWRGVAATRVVAELTRLERLGIRHVALYDDNFTVDRDRVVAICRGLLSRGSRLAWKCEARVDMVDRELLRWLARAGCKTIGFGVETAHQAGLDRLGKGTTVAQARNALQWARESGLETLAYVMVGIPGESPAHVFRTLDFCLEAGVSVIQIATLSALPGTPLWDEALAQGWGLAGRVRSLFDDESFRSTLVAPGWTRESLEQTVAEAQRRAWYHPRTLRTTLRRCRSWALGTALCRDIARTLARHGLRAALSPSG